MTDHDQNISSIVAAAREHYLHCKSDIANAKDRIEHIRLTALAQEAHNLLTDLIALETGIETEPASTTQDPLGLPEFQSPYKPENAYQNESLS